VRAKGILDPDLGLFAEKRVATVIVFRQRLQFQLPLPLRAGGVQQVNALSFSVELLGFEKGGRVRLDP